MVLGRTQQAPIFGARHGPRLEDSKRLHKLLSAYLQYRKIEGSTEATLYHKKKELGLFLRYLESNGHSMGAEDVSMFDVLGHMEEMKERGLAPASLNTRHRAMHAWFAWMVDWEILAQNPVSRVKAPKLPKVRKPFLTKEQFQKLLSLCPLSLLTGSRRASMLWILATTSMRLRELHMLNLEDLDWERGEIRVIHGKGQKERKVPFLKEAQLPTLRYLHNRDDSYPCLWISERRCPHTYYGVYQSIHQTFKRARIEVKDAVHIFRRTFAAHAVRQGMPRQYTQAIAGWSTTQMLDRYTAAMAEEEGAIEAFRNFKPFGAEDWGPIGYD